MEFSNMQNHDTKTIYNKLVRDNIPDIIKEKGDDCEWYVEGVYDEYIAALDKKLNEELAEYYQSNNLSELMDVVEVIYAILKARGMDLNEFHLQRREKRNLKGGFEQRIILKSVTERH